MKREVKGRGGAGSGFLYLLSQHRADGTSAIANILVVTHAADSTRQKPACEWFSLLVAYRSKNRFAASTLVRQELQARNGHLNEILVIINEIDDLIFYTRLSPNQSHYAFTSWVDGGPGQIYALHRQKGKKLNQGDNSKLPGGVA